MDYLLLAGIILVLYTIYIILDAFKSGWTAPNEATSSDLPAEPENRLIPNKGQIFQNRDTWIDSHHQYLEFTYEELARFNGNDEKKIYISIQNVVFDVTESGNDILLYIFYLTTLLFSFRKLPTWRRLFNTCRKGLLGFFS